MDVNRERDGRIRIIRQNILSVGHVSGVVPVIGTVAETWESLSRYLKKQIKEKESTADHFIELHASFGLSEDKKSLNFYGHYSVSDGRETNFMQKSDDSSITAKYIELSDFEEFAEKNLEKKKREERKKEEKRK